MNQKDIYTPISSFCNKFIEAGWLAAVVLSAAFMNIFTHRMFEPDKACLVRSIAILMIVAWVIKQIDRLRFGLVKKYYAGETVLIETESYSRPKLSIKNTLIYLPVLFFFISYLISTIFSVIPRASFWGSYDRAQGFYTTGAYLVVFLFLVTHIKTRKQVERLITAIIFTSLLVIAYGFLQKLGRDPVPWQMMDPSKRISSTMGNPIFFAAYLIMIVPLVLGRLLGLLRTSQQTLQSEWALIIHYFKIGFYSLVLPFLIIGIILSESRGPLLGLTVGIAFFFLVYAIVYRKKILIWSLVSGLVLAVAFVVIFNLPNTPLASLKKVPVLRQFGRLNLSEGSVRVRIILWGTALNLMRDNYKPVFPHADLIGAARWRLLLGYGPETLGNIFYRYHTPELVDYEGPTVHGDNCYNILLQFLVTQGALGLLAYLTLIGGIIYLALKRIRRVNDTSAVLLLGLISAIVAHFVETQFGIGIVVTSLHFWVFLGCIYAMGRLNGFQESTEAIQPIPSETTFAQVSQGDIEAETITLSVLDFIHWFFIGLFCVYLLSTFVAIVIVTEYYWPHLGTNIVAWIIFTYLWILLGILLGALSIKGREKMSFNHTRITLLSYIPMFPCLIIILLLSGFVITKTNLNPILADGYYKFCFSSDNEAERIRRDYYQAESLQGSRVSEKKGEWEVGYEVKKMLLDMFGLRLDSIDYYQRALRVAPNEKTYFNGMGRNFLELAKIWRKAKNKDWSLSGRDMRGDWIEIDINAPGILSGPPSIEEIMAFTTDEYMKFNQYDFFYCCFAAIKKGYEIEPTNYERRLAMAQVCRYGFIISRDDGQEKEATDYFNKAMEYYQLAKDASPQHPVPKEYMESLQKEMERYQIRIKEKD